MKRTTLIAAALISLMLVISACSKSEQASKTLTVLTHDSFNVSEEVVKAFEQENGVSLVFIKSGDAGAALNRAILTKKSPQADVFYGVDNTFLSRAIEEDIFEPYTSPQLSNVDEVFLAGTAGVATPVDYGDVCINYDIAWFSSRNLPLPSSLDDLLRLEYKDLLVVENPATSSPGLAFLLATIAEYGEQGYLEYWQGLKANGGVVVNDWNTAYYTNFSGSSGRGLQPLVVSYASSSAAEVIYAAEPLSSAPTASIIGRNTCFRQVEYAGILKGTKQLTLSQKFIDFMLDTRFQEDLPLQNFVYPINKNAAIPAEFERYVQIPAEPASLDPEVIAANRDKWIQAWTEVMLR